MIFCLTFLDTFRYLPKELLADWLDSLKAIHDEDARVLLLNKFVTNLPRVLMVGILDLIKEIKNEVNRIHLLNTIIPHLQPLLLTQAFEIIKEVKDGTIRSTALNTLIPHLTEPFLAETLVMVAEISDNTERTVTLEKLAVKLTQSSVTFLSVIQDSFEITLKALCRHPRPIFLLDLAALMPFILALAGDEAPQAAEGTYQAIQEVCGWWP